ncbi:MAG TPA: PadR family transcriptional regulator [Caulobacteraceae bacterium]|jgi:DNA-binding PadR family transcriptional regulator
MKPTTLDALLLFLVSNKGQSGYDVRQLFQSTPVGLFSDSPGAIYPALARLETRGLLASAAEPDGRRRRVYEQTDEGQAALRRWLTAPIDPGLVERRPQELDLRFVMIAEMLGRAQALAYLRAYAGVVEARHARVLAFHNGPGAAMSQASREAVELGIGLGQARLDWLRRMLSNSGEIDDEDALSRRPGA